MSKTCSNCGASLTKPGDFCLRCRAPNADGVVLDLDDASATLTILNGDTIVGETTITTTPQPGDLENTQQRNYVGRIADDIHRKRPETVYMAGDRELLGRLRSELHYDCYRVDPNAPVTAALARRDTDALEVVDVPPAEKIGGSHSTLIGGRTGRKAVLIVAGHPHVKKVIPGRINPGSSDSRTGTRAKATRADPNGNVRLLIHTGSTVQENRIVTTATNRDLGEQIREDLNDRLGDNDLTQ